ncbi:MAG: site-2 protease family protein [Chloroflexota bacterium]
MGGDLSGMIAILLALIVGITIHEFSHALAADALGDSTARYQGRLTLNPAAHFDPLGALMILYSVVVGWGFGWGKPVPVNPLRLRYGPRVGMALTAVAGPLSNLLIAAVAAAPFRLGLFLSGELGQLILTVVFVNVGLALFNMLPVPPLDGYSVLSGLLSTIRTKWAYDAVTQLDRLQAFGPMLFLLIILADQFLPFSILGFLLNRPAQWIAMTLLGA